MESTETVAIKYLPCRCPFLNETVWAILTQQSDGTWRIVNCLDKDTPCFSQPCAFTTDGGQWPYAQLSSQPAG